MNASASRRVTTIGALVGLAAGAAVALAPSALAASGGGCNTGSAGPAYQVSSCISAPGYAEAIGDAYVYMHSVPSGCKVTVNLWDYDLNYIVETTTVGCSTRMHVKAPELTGGYDTYRTQVIVDGTSGPWSPLEYLP